MAVAASLGEAAASSLTGKQLGKKFSWTFTTLPALSSAGLTVVAVPTSVGAQFGVSLLAAADVTMSIRNLAGREVAVLQPGRLDAGTRTLVWNRQSSFGTKVPTGTYLVQVQAQDPSGASVSQLLTLRLP